MGRCSGARTTWQISHIHARVLAALREVAEDASGEVTKAKKPGHEPHATEAREEEQPVVGERGARWHQGQDHP